LKRHFTVDRIPTISEVKQAQIKRILQIQEVAGDLYGSDECTVLGIPEVNEFV